MLNMLIVIRGRRRVLLLVACSIVSLIVLHRLTARTTTPTTTTTRQSLGRRGGTSSLKTQATKEGVSHEDVLRERKQLYDRVCMMRSQSVKGHVMEITGYQPANISYCVVQKAGCTTWIRLFKFLNGQNKWLGNPMSITKYQVHYEKQHLYKQYSMKENDSQFIRSSMRVTTVRNPYTRLWSAYIDKFILPDFWQTKGTEVIRRVRKTPNAKSRRCGHDVTFPEFIKYVIATGHELHGWNQDKHWLPAADICDPCLFKPHVIAKQETFLDDFRFVLRQSGLSYMADPIASIDHYEFEIKDEIDYNFKILRQHSRCTTAPELAQRLWMAFVLNGYLPVESRFPNKALPTPVDAISFYELVKKERTKHNVTGSMTKLARKRALTSAYAQLDGNTKQALRRLYSQDFKMFGYDYDETYF